MRQFVVIAHEAPTDADFSLDDLPGAGRIDVLCRCVTAALLRSHGIRSDVRVWLVIRDAITVRFDGSAVRHLNPDERSTGALIRKAIAARTEAVGHTEVETSPGVFVSKRGLTAVLDALGTETLIQLHADGRPVVEGGPPTDPAYVLSDHHDLTADEASHLSSVGADRVSLGPTALHADQAISVVHNYLDTDGYATYGT